MEKTKRKLIILAMLLIPCAGSMLRITSNSNIRSVDYIIILTTGAVTGLLIQQIIIITGKRN